MLELIKVNYIAMLKEWSDFQGKTKLHPFWYAVLGHFIVALLLSIVSMIFSNVPVLGFVFGFIVWLYGLVIIVPAIAMAIRRMRDIDKNPLLLLLGLIPLVGWIILVIYFIQPSK